MKTRPKYLKIAEQINNRITQGEFTKVGKLPNQKELATAYGVTVLTIKQALTELQNKGLISAVRGSGTFISTNPFRYQLKFLTSFKNEAENQVNLVKTTLISVSEPCIEDTKISKQFGAKKGTIYICIKRLRTVDGVPVILQHSYITQEIFNKLDPKLLTSNSLYEMLNTQANIKVYQAHESIQAIALPQQVALHLKQITGSVGLLSVRTTRDFDGVIVVIDHAYFAGDLAVIESERFIQSSDNE